MEEMVEKKEKLTKRMKILEQIRPYSSYLFVLSIIFLSLCILTLFVEKSMIFIFGLFFALSFYIFIYVKIKKYSIDEKINNLE
ncbi:MAG: hypothetical protein GY870_21090 [archaeon]|nr:hypothetical protein [archaeon]